MGILFLIAPANIDINTPHSPIKHESRSASSVAAPPQHAHHEHRQHAHTARGRYLHARTWLGEAQNAVRQSFLQSGAYRKHSLRVHGIPDFFSLAVQVIAGVFLSFGGLLSEVIQGGSPTINTDNPGLLKVLGGFVFPVGLVM